jgi:pimeloyl-ACP methyl ester carboxylesterase
MEWFGDASTSRNVTDRGFRMEVDGRVVPGVLWTPAEGDAGALVLLGHGGGANKRAPYIVAVARQLVRHHGIAAIAIDGPGHGDREDASGFDEGWEPAGATSDIIVDWQRALDQGLDHLGVMPVGYFGLSMGTMMGLPLVAAEPRITAAVLGLMGTWGPNREALVAAAPKVGIPLRFLLQWDDEIVPRDRCLALFDLIGSRKKCLHANPGPHADVPATEMRGVSQFLGEHLV